MIQSGNCYEMFFISFQKTISFFVRIKISDGSIEARVCETNEIINFNENTLYQREFGHLATN